MAKAKETKVAEEAAPEVAEVATPQPAIDLQDLAVALNLINVAIERGTYKPNELKTVGETYEKISIFLQFQAEQQAAAKAAAEQLTAQPGDE